MQTFTIYRDGEPQYEQLAADAREAITRFRVESLPQTSHYVFDGPATIRSLETGTVYEARGPEVDAAATLTKVYAIFDRLRAARPDTYRDDFTRVLAALMDNGPDAANTIVRDLLQGR